MHPIRIILSLLVTALVAQGVEPGRAVIELSGPGWKLWRDKQAAWKKDRLYLRHETSGLFKADDDPALEDPDKPGSLKLKGLKVNAPTGGWEQLEKQCEAEVSVPGTVEEYLWGKEGKPYDNDGAYFGVSWWWREFSLPAVQAGKRVLLHCGATRQRCEIYIDGKLCAYDAVGNTPYEFDVTPFVQRGGRHRIAFRITNPGGSFGWEDNPCMKWGDTRTRINLSHGFAGITGPVSLAVVGSVSISDLWMRNTPVLRTVIPTLSVENATGKGARRELQVEVRAATGETVVAAVRKPVTLVPGKNEIAIPVTVANARLWSPESPNLYVCTVRLQGEAGAEDVVQKRFGFRWFDVEGIGADSKFVLNGQRVRILSAISWGFWPQSGLIATPELAAQQVSTAKMLGLNCLNHHRTIGDPKTLDEADRQGLMYYEEAGGFEGYEADAFAYAMNREKFLRMVKRDRSHPSTIHYNLCNEPTHNPTEGQKRVMRDAHQLDPTRSITWGSGGSMGNQGHHPGKLWMKPEDMTENDSGWQDMHNAGVSDAYLDTLYSGPTDYHCRAVNNRAEIVFWGEEGPIGTPPRLALLKERCSRPGHRMGWDGQDWLQRYMLFEQWLKESGMNRWFTVDSLTQSEGDKQYYYQGRMIENARIDDSSDGYVVSGWENDKQNSICGLVDLWRNPKTENIGLIKTYAQPLYVAVKLREKIAHIGEGAVADFWIVNEKNIHGEAQLQVRLVSPSNRVVATENYTVKVTGGDRYGELLHEGLQVPALGQAGCYTLEASLLQKGKVVARGSDQLLAVDWKSARLPARGAVLETDGKLGRFLKAQKGVDLPAYSDALGSLDYVLVGHTVKPQPAQVVGGTEVMLPDGSGPGFLGEYFNGEKCEKLVFQRTDAVVDCDWKKEGLPDQRLNPNGFSVRWTGKLALPESGFYEFSVNRSSEGEVRVDNQPMLQGRSRTGRQMRFFNGGSVNLQITCSKATSADHFQIRWRLVRQAAVCELDSLIKRARENGTTVIFLEPVLVSDEHQFNDELPRALAEKGVISRYNGVLILGPVWLGGSYFAGAGPLFQGLPERTAFSWQYQLLAQSPQIMPGLKIQREPPAAGQQNIALRMPGVEALVGATTDFNADSNPKQPGTAVGLIPCGKGKFVVSTLQISPYLETPRASAHVVRKLLCNMIQLAARNDASQEKAIPE